VELRSYELMFRNNFILWGKNITWEKELKLGLGLVRSQTYRNFTIFFQYKIVNMSKAVGGMGVGNTVDMGIGSLKSNLTKQEFLAKYYKPEASDLGGNLAIKKSFVIRPKNSLRSNHGDSLRQSHAKLFTHQQTERNKNKKKSTQSSGEGDKSIFELMKEDISDPFEKALESKATTGQIVTINMCMGMLGLFGLCMAWISYKLEYEEQFDYQLTATLFMVQNYP
jgi:hypothetical protein